MRPGLSLRKWKFEDLESLLFYANNPKIAQNMTDGFPHPYLADDGIAFLNRVTSDDPQKVFAIDWNGEAIGSTGIFPLSDIFRCNAELGYWLGEPFWGQGILAECLPGIITYGFDTWAEVHRIFARPFGRNQQSVRVLEKAGFVLEARIPEGFLKNGKLEEELIYTVRRKTWKAEG